MESNLPINQLFSNSIIIGRQHQTHNDSDKYKESEDITWGDIKKQEEEICQYFISHLSSNHDKNKFSIEHRSEEYTSLFYGNNNFIRIKYTPESKWISISPSNEDRVIHINNPLFDMQLNKNQSHWKSKIFSKEDLDKYLDIANNACYELKVCGDEPLTAQEKAVADELSNLMIRAGAKDGHFKYRHLSDHAEICYIQGRIRFKCLKKKPSWIETDYKLAKKSGLGAISQFRFNDITEITKLQSYLALYIAEIDAHSGWYLKNGY